MAPTRESKLPANRYWVGMQCRRADYTINRTTSHPIFNTGYDEKTPLVFWYDLYPVYSDHYGEDAIYGDSPK